jgi:hypothetical protein
LSYPSTLPTHAASQKRWCSSTPKLPRTPFPFSSLSLLSPPFIILLPRPSFTYVLLLSLSFLFLPRLFPPGMKGRNKEVQEYNREVGQEGKDTIFVISISRTAFLLR